jgi:hypothetical protein
VRGFSFVTCMGKPLATPGDGEDRGYGTHQEYQQRNRTLPVREGTTEIASLRSQWEGFVLSQVEGKRAG